MPKRTHDKFQQKFKALTFCRHGISRTSFAYQIQIQSTITCVISMRNIGMMQKPQAKQHKKNQALKGDECIK